MMPMTKLSTPLDKENPMMNMKNSKETILQTPTPVQQHKRRALGDVLNTKRSSVTNSTPWSKSDLQVNKKDDDLIDTHCSSRIDFETDMIPHKLTSYLINAKSIPTLQMSHEKLDKFNDVYRMDNVISDKKFNKFIKTQIRQTQKKINKHSELEIPIYKDVVSDEIFVPPSDW